MKTIFIFGRPGPSTTTRLGPLRAFYALCALAGGCVAFDIDPSIDPECIDDDASCGAPHNLSGELMLLVNGRLSSAANAYQSNTSLGEPGTYVGPTLYLYDPLRECDDGGNGCRLAELGRLRLDERLGQASVQDESLRKFTVRDVAWHPDYGLWTVTYDSKNDEWGLGRIHVPYWSESGRLLPVDRWVVHPSEHPEAPGTDPCYWQESVSGLAFVGDRLLLGVRGLGGLGLTAHGMVYDVDLNVLEQGHCVDENDVSQDPTYYACANVCKPWAQFDEKFGVAGDLEADQDGTHVLSIVRSEDEALMPRERMMLFRLAPPDGQGLIPPHDTQTYIDGFAPGLEFEGMARVGGRLFAVNTRGLVFEVLQGQQTIVEHDDLAELFPDFPASTKIRGATTVVVADDG